MTDLTLAQAAAYGAGAGIALAAAVLSLLAAGLYWDRAAQRVRNERRLLHAAHQDHFDAVWGEPKPFSVGKWRSHSDAASGLQASSQTSSPEPSPQAPAADRPETGRKYFHQASLTSEQLAVFRAAGQEPYHETSDGVAHSDARDT